MACWRKIGHSTGTNKVESVAICLILFLGFILENTSCFQVSPKKACCSRFSPSTASILRVSTEAQETASSSSSSSSSKTKQVAVGDWEELHGNYLLRPALEAGPPRALIHFLGGAIVGAAPHVSYRYLLERLAAKGYLVVATPYNLSFDHLTTCDKIIESFERIAALLARTYGALPVVGIGHSCGALLQLLITSLFPDTPRAANALISFNNKPVSEAVPLFEEVVAPFFTYVAARNDTSRSSGSEIINVGLEVAKAVSIGEVPSDELLSRATRLLAPPGFSNVMKDKTISIPAPLRNVLETITAPTSSALENSGMAPIMAEFFDGLQQIPMLIDEVADGARDFVPPPGQVKAAARRSYRARTTLIIQYTEDALDESHEIEEMLKAAAQVIRMKRPMIEIDVKRRNLPGSHSAPLLAPPLDLAMRAETLLGVEVAKERLYYSQADQTVEEIVQWLEDSNL